MIFGLYEKRGEVDIWPSFLSFKVLFVKPPSLCPHVRHRARINLLNRLCEERIGRVNSSHGRIETRAFRVIRLRFRSTDVVWLVVLKEMCSGILPPSSQSTVF